MKLSHKKAQKAQKNTRKFVLLLLVVAVLSVLRRDPRPEASDPGRRRI